MIPSRGNSIELSPKSGLAGTWAGRPRERNASAIQSRLVRVPAKDTVVRIAEFPGQLHWEPSSRTKGKTTQPQNNPIRSLSLWHPAKGDKGSSSRQRIGCRNVQSFEPSFHKRIEPETGIAGHEKCGYRNCRVSRVIEAQALTSGGGLGDVRGKHVLWLNHDLGVVFACFRALPILPTVIATVITLDFS